MKCEKCGVETEGFLSARTGIRIPWCRDCMGLKPVLLPKACSCGRTMHGESASCKFCTKLRWARGAVTRLKADLAEAENRLKEIEEKSNQRMDRQNS